MDEIVKVEEACERYLGWIAGAKRTMRRLNQDRAEMRRCIDGLKGVRYDRIGGSSYQANGDDSMAAIVSRLEELDFGIASAAKDYEEAIADWLETKSHLNSIHAEVLTMHYIEGMTWEAVALEVRYSERNIYRLRMDALLALYEVLPEGWQ